MLSEPQDERVIREKLCGRVDPTVPEMSPAQLHWARCRKWIEAALEHAHGTHSLEDIEEGIAAGHFQFWPGKRSAIVSELISYPRKRALNFFLCGGDLEELKEMEPSISAWAKAVGCTHVIGVGRKGFERAFKDAGFRPAWWLVVKELES